MCARVVPFESQSEPPTLATTVGGATSKKSPPLYVRVFEMINYPWISMAENLPPCKMLTRVQNYLGMINQVSGFASGITFFVISTDMTFSDDISDPVYAEHRRQIFGVMIILSFILNIMSTLVGSLILGYSNICGEECINWFVRRIYMIIDLPLVTLVLGLFLLLVAAAVSIAGKYHEWVLHVCLIFGGLCTAFVFIMFLKMKLSSDRKLVMTIQDWKLGQTDYIQ